MSCEHLTGLPRVWCQVCEALRSAFAISTDDQAVEFARMQLGYRDKDAGDQSREIWDGWMRTAMEAMHVSGPLRTALEEAINREFPVDVATFLLAQFAWITAEVTGRIAMFNIPVQYEIAGELETARPDPIVAFRMFWRGLPEGTRNSLLHDLGWSQDLISRFGDILRPRLDPAELFRDAYLTDEDPRNVQAEMMRRGYTSEEAVAAGRLSKLIPGPGDLVRMAVREAWRDDVAAKWGYDQDFPPEFAEWMEKQGDVDDWSRKFWRAHWELPGVTLGMEMLHRVAEFGLSDFKELLRISDIPETFRDHIAEIAYVPLTRVDVRRMYGLGVLSRDEVKRNYLNLGYNDLNAERMTEFTVRFVTDEDREATKTDILSFYNVGALTAAEAISWLGEIGYPTDLAQYLVARETMKAEQKYVNEQVKYIKDMYIHQEIDVASATTQLGALGLTSGEITKLLDVWDIARESKIERPSRATLDKLFKRDVISESDYTSGLDALGYQQKYITWYLESVLLEKSEAARVAEEAARKEQEDIRKRKIKSDYQITKAGLDVDIAELQTAIAETQLALQERRSRYEEESRIAREALTVVQLEEQAAASIAETNAQIDDLREAISFLDEQIEKLQTEIAEIKLDQALATPTRTEEVAKRMIAEHLVTIEQTQDDIAASHAQIIQLHSDVGARREKLRKDINIVERVRAIEDIEADYRDDLASMTERLSTLRFNLTELREQKAVLTVEYRVGLAEE